MGFLSGQQWARNADYDGGDVNRHSRLQERCAPVIRPSSRKGLPAGVGLKARAVLLCEFIKAFDDVLHAARARVL